MQRLSTHSIKYVLDDAVRKNKAKTPLFLIDAF